MLDEGSNNFICSIYTESSKTGLAFCDVSTGELYVTLIDSVDVESAVKDELIKFSPKELLIGGDTEHFRTLETFIKDKLSACINTPDEKSYSYATDEGVIMSQFGQKSLDRLGVLDMPQTVIALGALLLYLQVTQKSGLQRIKNIEI